MLPALVPGDRHNLSKQTTTTKVFPVRDIVDGAIQLSDHSWTNVIHVQGIMFDWLALDEQDAIIQRYQAFLHTLQAPIQVVAFTEPVLLDDDIAYLHELTQAYRRQGTPSEKQLYQFGTAQQQFLAQHTQTLERVVYVLAQHGQTRDQVWNLADSTIRNLSMVHPDLQPQLMPAEAIATMWARISQVPWSVPLDHYIWDPLQLAGAGSPQPKPTRVSELLSSSKGATS